MCKGNMKSPTHDQQIIQQHPEVSASSPSPDELAPLRPTEILPTPIRFLFFISSAAMVDGAIGRIEICTIVGVDEPGCDSGKRVCSAVSKTSSSCNIFPRYKILKKLGVGGRLSDQSAGHVFQTSSLTRPIVDEEGNVMVRRLPVTNKKVIVVSGIGGGVGGRFSGVVVVVVVAPLLAHELASSNAPDNWEIVLAGISVDGICVISVVSVEVVMAAGAG